MNVFEEAIATGRIAEVRDLKILFWTLAKKLHPDSAALPSGERAFIKLKRDYDAAVRIMARDGGGNPAAPAGYSAASAGHQAATTGHGDFRKCAGLFSELIAGNFPMARKEGNKKYSARILELNRELGLFGFGDLFLECERELLGIRGDSIVMNHAFNFVRLFLYNLSDYFSTGNYFSKAYVAKTRESVTACLRDRGALGTIRLIDWFYSGLSA